MSNDPWRESPLLDFGKLSQQHRALRLKNALALFGLNALVSRAVEFHTGYEVVMPESEKVQPSKIGQPSKQFACKVLIDQPMEGLLLDSNTISLTDKVETQYNLTTDADLELEDKVTVTFPDGKIVNLRVVERNVRHPFTTIGNKYTAIVT